MHVEWAKAKLGIAAELMPLKTTENLAGVAIIVIRVYNDMGAKNIIRGNMDVEVSFDFACDGIYPAQYAMKNAWR